MLRWVKRRAIEKIVKTALNNEVSKMFKQLWDALDGKKTKLGDWGTYILIGLDAVSKLATDPNFHQLLSSLVAFVPSWGIYATLLVSTIGRLDQLRKFLISVKK